MMKRFQALLIIAAAWLTCAASAQPMGTLTENGKKMDVKATVVLLDAAKPAVTFFLLPFQPTPEEVSMLRAGESFWLLKKASPDPKKWGNCPYGKLQLSWSLAKKDSGDAKKAFFWLYTYSVGEQGSNLNINRFADKVDVSLSGALKEGQDVTVTTKGSDTQGDRSLLWDLKVTGKVLTTTNQ